MCIHFLWAGGHRSLPLFLSLSLLFWFTSWRLIEKHWFSNLAEASADKNTSNYNPSDNDHKFKSEPIKSYTDEELSGLIDSIMETIDLNKDGFVTYAEFKNPTNYEADNMDYSDDVDNAADTTPLSHDFLWWCLIVGLQYLIEIPRIK